MWRKNENPIDYKKKITGFNQKDVEIAEKQLFLAIKGIEGEGDEEEFLRKIFERNATPSESDLFHSEQLSVRNGWDDGLEVDRYGLRNGESNRGVG